MGNVIPAVQVRKGTKADLTIGYQQIKCHMIFDVKMGENFRIKPIIVGGGHMTEATSLITYFSVVSQYSVRIALTVTAFNGLDLSLSLVLVTVTR